MAHVSLYRRIAAVVIPAAAALAILSCAQPNDPATPDPAKAPVISVSADQDTSSFIVNLAITPITVANSGPAASSYTVSPALPAGLAINATTGEISGTPTAVTASGTYQIIATNFDGSDTFSVVIKVRNPAEGLLYIRADDAIDSLYVNGVLQTIDTSAYQAGGILIVPFGPYTGSTITIGVAGNNSGFWSGSVMASLLMNDATSFASDASWKCSFTAEAGWGASGFNDAVWLPVGDYGAVDSTCYWPKDSSCILTPDSCPMRFFKQGNARSVWTPKKTYFRKAFTMATAKTAVMKVGSEGGAFTAYINGTQVATGYGTAAVMDSISVNLVAGVNVLAAVVTDTAPNSNGIGIKFGGGIYTDSSWVVVDSEMLCLNCADPFNPTAADSADPTNWWVQTTENFKYTTYAKSDTSWHYSAAEETGWQQTSFTEGASWKPSDTYGVKFSLPVPGGPTTSTKPLCSWLWSPKKALFRKEFTIQ